MLFVALFKVRAGTEEERLARRLQLGNFEGVNTKAEYWLHTPDPESIHIFEAESFAAMMQITGTWNDLYDVKIYPAIEAAEGIEMARQMTG